MGATTPLLPALAGLTAVALLLYAAVSDARRYLIPDHASVALVIAFVIALPLAPAGWMPWQGLAAALACFAVGAGLFALGTLGGGDVKLIAATALWAGALGTLMAFLFVMALAGALIAAALLVRLRLSPGGPRPRLPYALAIAPGGALALVPAVKPLMLAL